MGDEVFIRGRSGPPVPTQARNFHATKRRAVHLLDTLNMFVKSTANFVEAFKIKVSAQKMRFCPNIPTPF